MAKDPTINSDTVGLLIRDPDWVVAAAAAAHPHLTQEQQYVALDTGKPAALALLAERNDCAPAVLERLGMSDDWGVRLVVARNPHTPLGTLATLIKGTTRQVAAAAYKNPHLSEQDRRDIVGDQEPPQWRPGYEATTKKPVPTSFLGSLVAGSPVFAPEPEPPTCKESRRHGLRLWP